MSGALYAVARGERANTGQSLRWARATLLQALGWVLSVVLRDVVPDTLSIVAGNGLVLLSLALYLLILADFCERPRAMPWVFGLAALLYALHAYYALVVPNVQARLVLVSACAATLMLKSAEVLWSVRTGRFMSMNLMAGLYALFGGLMVARAMYYLLGYAGSAPVPYGPSAINTFSAITIYATSTLLTVGFLLMRAQRDIEERVRSERALQEAKGFLQLVVDSSPNMIFVKNDKGRAVFVNRNMAEYYGTTPDQILSKTTKDVHPRASEALLYVSDDMHVIRSRIRLERDELNTLPNGEQHWFHTIKVPLVHRDGTVDALGIATDITERKRAEEALRDSEAFNVSVIDSLAEHIAVLDEQGVIVAVNAAWKDFAERNDASQALCSAIGMNYFDACVDRSGSPVDAAAGAAEAGIRAVMAGAQPGFQLEYPCHAPDEQRWFQLRAAPLQGVRRGVVVSHTNITERRLAEEHRKHSEERYQAIVEWSPDAIFIHRDGKFLYANAAALRLFGAKSASDLIGTLVIDRVPLDEQPHVSERMGRQTRDGGVMPSIERTFLRLDGSAAVTDIAGLTINYDGGPAILGVAHDITERKRAEAAHASLEAQLRESQKMEAIGTLAGGIAHDFNNIIAAILGNTDLARDDTSDNARAQESLQEIEKAARRARELVQQILSFSRRQPSMLKPLSLAPAVQESVRLLRATLPARVSLEVHCESDLPSVMADTVQIQQLVINLCTNALQAMPLGPGRIEIRLDALSTESEMPEDHPELRALRDAAKGSVIRLSVSDTGHGMDAATRERIFEPFFTTKPVGEGTGLGLSVVHGIVRGHAGVITVASEPGQGTTFTLYLPAANPEAGDVHPPAAECRRPPGECVGQRAAHPVPGRRGAPGVHGAAPA